MKKSKNFLYLQNRKRSFKKIKGTLLRPRISIFRSNNHIYAQLIDDTTSKTFVSASTVEKILASQISKTSTKNAAFFIGKELGTRALQKGFKKLIFDCNYKPYLGRIKSLAEGLRTTDLEV